MIEPKFSAVSPRIYSPHSGAVLQLVDEIELLLDRAQSVKVRLDGAGNLAAISHLAAALSDEVANGRLHLGDTLPLETTPNVLVRAGTVHSQTLTSAKEVVDQRVRKGEFDIVLRLAPWGRDDFIEYLLAEHPGECASVMQRLQQTDCRVAGGSPIVWQTILNRMASDESRSDLVQILLDEIDLRINDRSLGDAIADRLISPSEPDCMGVFGHPSAYQIPETSKVSPDWRHCEAAEFLADPPVQRIFAMRRFADRLGRSSESELHVLLGFPFRQDALIQVAKHVAQNAPVLERLQGLFDHNAKWSASNAATVLANANSDWRPRGKSLQLYRAYFHSVNWQDIDLSDADLRKTTFANANLAGARLHECQFALADFSHANLHVADLSCVDRELVRTPPIQADDAEVAEATETEDPAESVEGDSRFAKFRKRISKLRGRRQRAKEESVRKRNERERQERNRELKKRRADSREERAAMQQAMNQFHRTQFNAADLSQANLSGCCFMESDFRQTLMKWVNGLGSSFIQAKMAGADLTNGNFAESAFSELSLSDTSIDGGNFSATLFDAVGFAEAVAENVSFSDARMAKCIWTESRLSRCNFSGANLSGGRMAEVQWDHCDLRGANLIGCTFHMGSTRCGLVDSPYPSHGTRTGFYTDDYNDQHFQAPEVIRKASLFGCDLRGAKILGVDFYLVDLREAKFDEDQRQQLIATGAILDEDVC